MDVKVNTAAPDHRRYAAEPGRYAYAYAYAYAFSPRCRPRALSLRRDSQEPRRQPSAARAARALDIFDRLAKAEAKLHGSTVEQVEFHEVGAIDSIVDVVGTAAALAWLEPSGVTCASVAMGHGTLKSAHGVLPVPAPAALEVLRDAGGVMTDGGLARELCTPTGAAILAASVTSWTAAPTGRAIAVGWGAGDLDFADRPNVVRAVLVEPGAAARSETVWQIEANIDDMTGELCAPPPRRSSPPVRSTRGGRRSR